MKREQSETNFVLVSAGGRARGEGGEIARLGERDVLLWWKRRRRRRELQATRGQLEGGSEGGEDGEEGSTCKGGVRIGRWGDGRQHLLDDG